jgi:alanine racemase
VSLLYQTHARIHLGNIRANLRAIRAAVGAEVKILVAVKANAYGHGAVQVSRLAEAEGMDWLGVATVPEAMELRAAGIGLPVLKLSPSFPEELAAALDARVTLSIGAPDNALALEALCAGRGQRTAIHLIVDTGMARVGAQPQDAPALARLILDHCPHLDIEGIFTHLPVSDDPDPGYTRAQIQRFREAVAAVETVLGRPVGLVHCANSGAVLGHRDGWLNMVRPGIMVYGFRPGPGTPATIPLLPGLTLATRVSFLKQIPAGTRVGYGLTWSTERDTWIATIPAGYADGFNRLFSNRGRVLIGGRSYPVAGRVCMDQTMIDLGPETDVQVGDEVILLGRSGDLEITCEEWAQALVTITYEVTCQINARVPRLFDPL